VPAGVRRQWDRLCQDGDSFADIDGTFSQGKGGDGIDERVDLLAQVARIGLLPQLLQELSALGGDRIGRTRPFKGGLRCIVTSLEVRATAFGRLWFFR
jgi:hypothetical protein